MILLGRSYPIYLIDKLRHWQKPNLMENLNSLTKFLEQEKRQEERALMVCSKNFDSIF